MDEVYRFKPHWSVELAGEGVVFLVGEHERFVLAGRLYELVAPLLDGQRTVDDIIAELDGRASPPEVYHAITTLQERGYLAAPDNALSPEVAAFWHALGLGVEGALVASRLAAAPVTVVAMGGEDPAPLAEALAGAGVVVEEGAALRVVVTRDYLDPGFAALNRQALDERFRWMPVKPGGSTPWIGPMFHPGQGPCWECLAQRLRTNRPVETFLAERLGRLSPIVAPRASLPTSARFALDLAALTAARWIVDGGRGTIDAKLLALDLRQTRIEEHAVTRRPQCPACGDPGLLTKQGERPVALSPRPKRFTDDGGYRSMTPEDTSARLAPLISPITGIVTSLGPVPERDHPLRPVYGAGFFVRAAPDRIPSFDALSRTSLGKGRTAAQSRAGALCEAIERYSSVLQGDEPLLRARISELGGDAVRPGELLNFSETQYRTRDERNRGVRDRRRWIPLPFDEGVAIEWAPVWSLTTGQRRHVPAAFCYLGVSAPPEERFCEADPNGHAAGNCLEEAILQAFLELSERDAVGIWWHNRLRRPAVDLQSFEEPYFTALEDHYRHMSYRLWVLDVTNDLDIPAFVALARSTEKDRWCVGFGCHLEARLGVQRALTELNQLFEPAGASRAPWGQTAMDDESFLFPDDGAASLKKGDRAFRVNADMRGDVEACVERAARLGLETLVLDQTRPDIGLHAVKVIVPGLRHFWPRLGPGRLHDVPVQMGWLAKPRTDQELNPVPLYL